MTRVSLTDEILIEPTSGVDFSKVNVTSDEWFVFSRLEGRRQKVGDVIRSTGMPPERARPLVEGLMSKGVVLIVGGFGPAAVEKSDEYEGFVFPVAAMQEQADLTDAQRKRILFIEAKLDEWNHYALLGLKRTAPSSDIKRAYFKASKEFHPDAFFRKELGTFRPRIDRIFRTMKLAYDVLSNEDLRKTYDSEVVTGFTPEELKELAVLADEQRARDAIKARDDRLADRMKERRLKHNPMVERIQKGKSYQKLAEDALAAGKFAEASRHAKLAVEYAPQDDAVKKRTGEIVEEANRGQAHALLKKVDMMMKTMEPVQLAEAGEQLAALGPKDPVVLAASARLLHAGSRPQRALRFAQQAVALNPKQKDALELLYQVAKDEKGWNIALRAAETLTAMDPKNANYKDWVKTAKRNV